MADPIYETSEPGTLKHSESELVTESKTRKDEKDLKRRAMKLDLAPLLGKAFRYVTVSNDGECEEVDEQFVLERRAALLQGTIEGIPSKKGRIKKVRKARPTKPQTSSASAYEGIAESFDRPGWLPDSLTLTHMTSTHMSGWVNTEEELAQVLTKHSAAYSCRFVSWYKSRGQSNACDLKRISWKRDDIVPDCPFSIDNYVVRHCPYGMNLKRLEHARQSTLAAEKPDAGHSSISCSAKLKIRRVTLYDGFHLAPKEQTKRRLLDHMMSLKQLMAQGQEVQVSARIYLQLPLPAAHSNHAVPEYGQVTKVETLENPDSMREEEEYIQSLFDLEQSEISFESSLPSLPKLELREMGSGTEEKVLPAMVEKEESRDAATDNMKEVKERAEEGVVRSYQNFSPLAETDSCGAQSFLVDDVGVGSFMTPSEFEQDQQQILPAQGKKRKEDGQLASQQFEIRPAYKRSHILSSCKVDCPARIRVKRVSLYEGFHLEPGDSHRIKDDKMILVKDLISSGASDLQATSAIFMQLPLAAAHRNHQVTLPPQETSDGSHHIHNLSWLPRGFNISTSDTEYVTGWVLTQEEYLQVMEAHRFAFNCSFLTRSNDKERTYKTEAERRVMWKKDFVDPSCPFTVHHSMVLSCAFSDLGKGSAQRPTGECVYSDQAELVSHFLPEEGMEQLELPLMTSTSDSQENVLQTPALPSGFMADGTSLKIEYCDIPAEYADLQPFMEPNETYVILVENS